jgi:predicted amidohydrolase YtcJ
MLKENMLADFAIMEEDPRAVDPERLDEIKISRTIIGGETVFEG